MTTIPDIQLPPGLRWGPLHHRSDDKYGAPPIAISGIRTIEHDVKTFRDGVSWTIKFKTFNTDWRKAEIGEYMVLEKAHLFKITGVKPLPLEDGDMDRPWEVTGLAVVEHVPNAVAAERPIKPFHTGVNPALRKTTR